MGCGCVRVPSELKTTEGCDVHVTSSVTVACGIEQKLVIYHLIRIDSCVH